MADPLLLRLLNPAILNTLGLLLTILGCALLYCFGLPPDFDPLGRCYLQLQQSDQAEIAKGNRFRRLGRCGLALIIAGAILQISANWLPTPG